jgi:hypothetical protein
VKLGPVSRGKTQSKSVQKRVIKRMFAPKRSLERLRKGKCASHDLCVATVVTADLMSGICSPHEGGWEFAQNYSRKS